MSSGAVKLATAAVQNKSKGGDDMKKLDAAIKNDDSIMNNYPVKKAAK